MNKLSGLYLVNWKFFQTNLPTENTEAAHKLACLDIEFERELEHRDHMMRTSPNDGSHFRVLATHEQLVLFSYVIRQDLTPEEKLLDCVFPPIPENESLHFVIINLTQQANSYTLGP